MEHFKMMAQDYLVTPIAELQGEASHTIHHHITRHDLTHLKILGHFGHFSTKSRHHQYGHIRSNLSKGHSNDLWIQNNDSM